MVGGVIRYLVGNIYSNMYNITHNQFYTFQHVSSSQFRYDKSKIVCWIVAKLQFYIQHFETNIVTKLLNASIII